MAATTSCDAQKTSWGNFWDRILSDTCKRIFYSENTMFLCFFGGICIWTEHSGGPQTGNSVSEILVILCWLWWAWTFWSADVLTAGNQMCCCDVNDSLFQNHCFYHGRVRGHPDSWIAVSTCSGVRYGYCHRLTYVCWLIQIRIILEEVQHMIRWGCMISVFCFIFLTVFYCQSFSFLLYCLNWQQAVTYFHHQLWCLLLRQQQHWFLISASTD